MFFQQQNWRCKMRWNRKTNYKTRMLQWTLQRHMAHWTMVRGEFAEARTWIIHENSWHFSLRLEGCFQKTFNRRGRGIWSFIKLSLSETLIYLMLILEPYSAMRLAVGRAHAIDFCSVFGMVQGSLQAIHAIINQDQQSWNHVTDLLVLLMVSKSILKSLHYPQVFSNHNCFSSIHTLSPGTDCKDTSKYCNNVKTMGLCRLHRFQQSCCASCKFNIYKWNIR
jgi:hypothetical protein